MKEEGDHDVIPSNHTEPLKHLAVLLKEPPGSHL